MALIVRETGGKSAEPIPEGTYTAVCYGITDLGTHRNDTYDKNEHKVLVQWEVPDVLISVEHNGEMVDMPRAISRKYTMSLHEKASLRKDLEAWRGKRFTATELEGFDISVVAGAACLMGIVHEARHDGKGVYAAIASIMALPKGAARPKPINPVVVWEIPDGSNGQFEIPSTFPTWIAEKVMESMEYSGKMPVPFSDSEPAPEHADDTSIPVDDEALPF